MKTKTWIGLLAGLLALCLGLSIWLLWPREDAARVQIKSQGEVLYTLDLSRNQELTVTTGQGSNTITIKDGKIAVTAADCPDHYCMQRGWCTSGTPIVCLPNGLVIEFLEGSEIDGAVG